MRKTIVLVCLVGLLLAGIVAQNMTPHTDASTRSQVGKPQPAATVYRVKLVVYLLQRAPSISAALIHLVLTGAHSPAAKDAQALYDLGVHYGIDPVFALGFFQHESSFGTTGEATVTRSLGNERCIADRSCNARGFAVFTSWVDGFDHWYRLILHGYTQGQINQAVGRKVCPCLTVEQIVPIYAPESSGNHVAGYITAIEHDVSAWRAGQVSV